jgi:hypothetical protein
MQKLVHSFYLPLPFLIFKKVDKREIRWPTRVLELSQLFAVSLSENESNLYDYTRYSRHGRIFTLPDNMLSNFKITENDDLFLDGEIWYFYFFIFNL